MRPQRLLAVIGSVLPVCIAAYFLLILIHRRFPDQDLIITARQVLGKKVAFGGNLLFLSCFVVWLILAIRDSGELTLIYFLNRTPIWALLTLFLIGVGYLAINGLRPVIRLAAFVLIPTVLFRFLMQLIALQGFKATNLLTLFARPPLDYLLGSLNLANVFFPITALFLIHPLLKKKSKIGLPVFCATSIASISFFLGIIWAIGVFGHELAQRFA